MTVITPFPSITAIKRVRWRRVSFCHAPTLFAIRYNYCVVDVFRHEIQRINSVSARRWDAGSRAVYIRVQTVVKIFLLWLLLKTTCVRLCRKILRRTIVSRSWAFFEHNVSSITSTRENYYTYPTIVYSNDDGARSKHTDDYYLLFTYVYT